MGAARDSSEYDGRVRRLTSRAATAIRGGGDITGGGGGTCCGDDDDDDDGCEMVTAVAIGNDDDCEDKRASFSILLACSSITISR